MRTFLFLVLGTCCCAAVGQAPPPSPLHMTFADNRQWVLMKPIRYVIGNTQTFVEVPEGFVTDFASIPQAFWSFGLSPNGRYSRAAVVHDYLYWSQACTKSEADNLLVIAMKESRVDNSTRTAIFEGVHVGGMTSWNANTEERRQKLPRVIPRSFWEFDPQVLWDDYRKDLRTKGVEDPPFTVDPVFCEFGRTTDVPGG